MLPTPTSIVALTGQLARRSRRRLMRDAVSGMQGVDHRVTSMDA